LCKTQDQPAKRNIKLIIAYDGTDFFGWQRQDNRGKRPNGKRTVQCVIEEALQKIHKGPVILTGSGRTDSGVHAAAQAANFYTSIQSMEAGRFVPALNSLLPHDVRVLDACEVSLDFHARFDARLRSYRYFFITRRNAMPWELRYAWHLRRRPDLNHLNEYCRLFRGEMDFTAFAVPGDKSKSRSRFIKGASFFVEAPSGQEMEGEKLVFEITANAFLWKMVRSIAGTLIRFEEKGLSVDYLQEVIEGRRRSLTGPTSPPEGLFLWKIVFDNGLKLPEPVLRR
jgi:tRNA pseudouridine38-40 synthase